MDDRLRISDELFDKAEIDVTYEETNFLAEVNRTHKDSWGRVTASIYSSKLLERALTNHSQALIRQAESSDRYTVSMQRASWILAIATIVLAGATIVLAYAAFF